MKKSRSTIHVLFSWLIIALFTFSPELVLSQRMNHGGGASRGGGMSAPSRGGNMSAPSRSNMPQNRPSTSAPRGGMTSPSGMSGNSQARTQNPPNRNSINGGAQPATDRRPSTGPANQNRSITDTRQSRDNQNMERPGSITGNQGRPGSTTRNQTINNDRSGVRGNGSINGGGNVGNRPGGNRPGGNNINISKNNNININAQRNTVVRVNVMSPVMMRPPVIWGGFMVWSANPFFWFAFRPFYWGPMWYPWGYPMATIPPAAQVVNVTNVTNEKNITNVTNVTNVVNEFFYDDGVFYEKDDSGFVVVPGPVGAEVSAIPDNYEKVTLDDGTINYFWGGTYYEKSAKGYTVVPPTAGALVANLPDGGEEVKMGDVILLRYGDTYYQPVQVNGQNRYEVVFIEEEEEKG